MAMGWLGQHELTEKAQVRLTKRDISDLRKYAKQDGTYPGTVLRKLVVGWLESRRAKAGPVMPVIKQMEVRDGRNELVRSSEVDTRTERAKDDEPWRY